MDPIGSSSQRQCLLYSEQGYQALDAGEDSIDTLVANMNRDQHQYPPTMTDYLGPTCTAPCRISGVLELRNASNEQSSYSDNALASTTNVDNQFITAYDSLDLDHQAYPAWPFLDPSEDASAYDAFGSALRYDEPTAQDPLETLMLCQPAQVDQVGRCNAVSSNVDLMQRVPTASDMDINPQLQYDEDLLGVDPQIHVQNNRKPGDSADPCYAKLLWRCLSEVPDHTLSLKDMYEWISQNTQKARHSGGTGWQNSIRHNLSMNKAFQKANPSEASGGKKTSLWRLTDHALRFGILSTTRYRNPPKNKAKRITRATPKRAAPGARGGQATRRAAHNRRGQTLCLEALAEPSSGSQQQQHQQSPYAASPLSGFSTTMSTYRALPISAMPSRAAIPYFSDCNEHAGVMPRSQPAPQHALGGLHAPPPTPRELHLAAMEYARHGLFASYHDSPSTAYNTPSLVMSDASFSAGTSPTLLPPRPLRQAGSETSYF